ncbi:hypothetical protein CDV55_107258 [Aspergillus turcosus]|nr:hypothetical protein CDV55_107258 [Aspergillus turcosus]
MAITDNAEHTTPMNDLKTDPEQAREPIPSDKPGDAKKLEDAGPPDGGVAARLVVLGACCCSFSSPGWINSVGSFQQYYEAGPLENYSSSTIAWIPSLQLFVLGLVVGMIFDNGPRPLITGKTLLHILGLMMASLTKTYYQFILSHSRLRPNLVFQEAWSSYGHHGDRLICRRRHLPHHDQSHDPEHQVPLGHENRGLSHSRPADNCNPHSPPKNTARAQEDAHWSLRCTLHRVPLCHVAAGFISIDYLAVQGFQEAHIRWNMFIIACTVSAISEFAVWIPAKHSSIAIGFAIMLGFALGVVFLAIWIPALAMAPIGGAILQNSTNGRLDVKIFGGVMCLAGSAIVLLSRWLYTEKKLLKVF